MGCWAGDPDSSEGSDCSDDTEASCPATARAPGEPTQMPQGRRRAVKESINPQVVQNGGEPRRGAVCAIDRDALAVSTVTSHVNECGIGLYQYAVLAAVGISLLAESLDMSAVGPLHAALGHQFNLSVHERSMLTAFVYLGSGFAVLVAGPFTDYLGRKSIVIASVVSIAISFLALVVLTDDTHYLVILALRALSGSAAGIGGMAGTVLAVESCPTEWRARFMFGINFVSSCGYVFGAGLVELTMRGFGEEPSDDWRTFSVVMGLAPLLSLPFLLCISESPLFLAVRGDLGGAIRVLNRMAAMNGAPPPDVRLPARRIERMSARYFDQFLDGMARVSKILATHTMLLILLSMIDGPRSFFTAGSSYIWKDLFYKVGGEGPVLNTLSSLSPLIGLAICERFLWTGKKHLTFACSLLATIGFCFLAIPWVQTSIWPLLSCVMVVKLTYAPLVTAVSIMKAEIFPTEVRATAFSLVTVVAKFACMIAPSMIEEMHGKSWSQGALTLNLFLLAANSLTCGILVCWVPEGHQPPARKEIGEGRGRDERLLSDERAMNPMNSDEANIWDDEDGSE